jgi:hypothetical protein
MRKEITYGKYKIEVEFSDNLYENEKIMKLAWRELLKKEIEDHFLAFQTA